MGYRVDYQPARIIRRREKIRARRVLLTLLCFSLFLILVFYQWPEATIVVQDTLAAIRPTVVVSAMDDMANSFQDGMHFLEAVRHAFPCFLQGGRIASG